MGLILSYFLDWFLEALFACAGLANGEAFVSERGFLSADDARVFGCIVQPRPSGFFDYDVRLWSLHYPASGIVDEDANNEDIKCIPF